VHHRTIQINHQPDATIFSVYYPDICLQLNMFRAFPARHQELNDCSGSLWFYLRTVVAVMLCSWQVKPEAATAVIEPLVMGGKTLETC
jgi:hypothetical protein